MPNWDIDKLVSEVARVRTAGLGRPLREGAEADQLLSVARLLVPDTTLLPFRLYEEALLPSIERLGSGPLGRLAWVEFRVAPEAQNLHSLKQRRAAAEQELDITDDRLKTLEKEMHRAIAEDLLARMAESGLSTTEEAEENDDVAEQFRKDRFSEVAMEKRKAEGYF